MSAIQNMPAESTPWIKRLQLRRRRPDAINIALYVWSALILVFLLAPIITVVVFAFNKGELGRQTAQFTGFTTKWFAAAWNTESLRSSLWVSLKVAVPMAFISTILGTAAGLAMVRHPWKPVRRTLEGLMYYLLVVPEIVLGISLLIFYTRSHVSLGYMTLIAGHSPFPIAVVALIVRSRVVALDGNLESAAADLGARTWVRLRDIVIPQLLPAVIAGLIMTFTFSLDDLIISEMLATPSVSTLPVYIFGSAARNEVDPSIYAIATLMLAVTLIGFALVGLVFRFFGKRDGGKVSLTKVVGAA